MELVAKGTGLYTYEYKDDEIKKITEQLNKNNKEYYIEEKYHLITILR